MTSSENTCPIKLYRHLCVCGEFQKQARFRRYLISRQKPSFLLKFSACYYIGFFSVLQGLPAQLPLSFPSAGWGPHYAGQPVLSPSAKQAARRRGDVSGGATEAPVSGRAKRPGLDKPASRALFLCIPSPYSRATASISTNTSLGRRATSTAERAG